MSNAGDDDLAELKALACDRLEELAEDVMGLPNPGSRRGRDWRWGSKGGQSLVVRGSRRGLFYAFDGDTGGSVLDMITFHDGRSFGDAVAWLRSWLGIGDADPLAATAEMQAARAKRRAAAEAQEAAELAGKLAFVRDLWRRADRDFSGTAGDIYLRETRRIPAPASGWPESVRFDRWRNALAFGVTDPAGELVAVQLVYVGDDGRKLGDAELRRRGLPSVKMSHGPRSAGVVRLPGDPAGPLLLAEGPETGLSAWAATGYETWVALGGVGTVDVPAGRRVIVCSDDDPRFSPGARKLRRALANWRRAGLDVVMTTPWERRRYDKADLNDALKAGGVEAVRARVLRGLLDAGASNPQPARLPVAEARRKVDRIVRDFFDRASAHVLAGEGSAPVLALPSDTGVGKSTSALQHAYRAIDAARAKGFRLRVLYSVPTVQLGDELAAKQHAAGRQAAVRRGREQPDPATGGKEKMCRNIPAVRDAMEAGASVEEAACRKRMPNGTVRCCPFYESCGYYRQDAEQRDADIVFIPHDLLTMPRPKALNGNAILVADENPLRPFMIGHEGDGIAIALDALAANDEILDRKNPLDALTATQELRDFRRKLLAAVRDASPGPLTRDLLIEADLTAANCRSAYALEWKRKIEPAMWPGMPADDRRLARLPGENNRMVHRFARMWRALEALLADGGPLASGWVEVGWCDTAIGPVKALRVKGRKQLGTGWTLPTLLLDATMQPELLQHVWPNIEAAPPVAVAVPPGVRIAQVDDRTFSLARLAQFADEDDGDEAERQTHGRRRPSSPEQAREWREEADRRRRALRDLHAWLVCKALSYGSAQVLIVAQLRVKEALLKLGNFPPNVVWTHHNGADGRDEWKRVRAEIIIGRTQPRPEAVERMAEALTGAAVARLAGWYPRVDAVREMRDGRLLPAEADRHPDPIAEAFRWRACEGGLIQLIGRTRWADRSEANPLDIFLLTDVPVPFPVDELISAADLRPSPHDLMIAAGGIAFENPTDAAAAYPELWPNREAAKSAMRERGRLGSDPYRGGNIGERPQPPLTRTVYQVGGPGRSPAVAWFAPALCRDPRAAVEAAVGPVVRWEVGAADLVGAPRPRVSRVPARSAPLPPPPAPPLPIVAPPAPGLPVIPVAPVPAHLLAMMARIEADPLNLGLPPDPDGDDDPPWPGAPVPPSTGPLPFDRPDRPRGGTPGTLTACAALALVAAGTLRPDPGAPIEASGADADRRPGPIRARAAAVPFPPPPHVRPPRTGPP